MLDTAKFNMHAATLPTDDTGESTQAGWPTSNKCKEIYAKLIIKLGYFKQGNGMTWWI